MFRERIRLFIELDIALDIMLTATAFILAILVRQISLYQVIKINELLLLFQQYAWVLLIAYPFLIISLFLAGAYGPLRFKPTYLISWIITRSFLITILSLVFIFYIFKVHIISRLFLAAFGVIGAALLIIKKFIEISFLHFLRQKGFNLKYIVIAAEKNDFDDIIKKIQKNGEYGLEVVALVNLDKDRIAESEEKQNPILYYGLKGLKTVLNQKVVDYVLFTGYKNNRKEIEKGLFMCEEHGVEAWLATDFFNMSIAHQTIDDFFGTPVVVFHSAPLFSGKLIVKRLIDLVVSCGLLLLAMPFFILIAVAIKVESLGPVIFSQRRIGLNGRIFTLYKFRSMVSEAEQKKQELERFNEISGPVFKITNDPRVTKVGKFLRKYSLDELPQLINVLKGEMSLVGPRPLPDYEAEKLEGRQRRRLCMQPGLTCLWQIRGRSDIDFYEWVKYDLEYIDNWGIGLDLYILFKTIPIVFASKGAY